MAVICAVCHTENRDAAMFCHGCARKLPAFVATAPSLLETMRTRDAEAAARPSSRLAAVTRRAVREPLFPLGVALLVAALTVGWYAQATREPPKAARVASAVSAVSAVSVAAKPAVVAPAAVAVAPVKPETPKPADPVPVVASLAPGEIELSPGPAMAPVAPAPPVALAAPTEPDRRSPPRAAAPPRQVALDPRHGCETLNFVFAARCEAAHCDKAEYARHPRCNLVREERRRDEARRNPTLGF